MLLSFLPSAFQALPYIFPWFQKGTEFTGHVVSFLLGARMQGSKDKASVCLCVCARLNIEPESARVFVAFQENTSICLTRGVVLVFSALVFKGFCHYLLDVFI